MCLLTDFAILFLLQSYCPSLPCLLQLHMPHCHTPLSYMHSITISLPATCASQLHGYVANPLPVAYPTWPCTSQPHILYCHTPLSHMHPCPIAAHLAAAYATLPSPLQPHTLHCHPPHTCTATLWPPLQLHTPCHHLHCSYTCYVATYLAATWALSLPPLQPHTSHHCAPHSCMAILLPLLQLHTSPHALQLYRPHYHTPHSYMPRCCPPCSVGT